MRSTHNTGRQPCILNSHPPIITTWPCPVPRYASIQSRAANSTAFSPCTPQPSTLIPIITAWPCPITPPAGQGTAFGFFTLLPLKPSPLSSLLGLAQVRLQSVNRRRELCVFLAVAEADQVLGRLIANIEARDLGVCKQPGAGTDLKAKSVLACTAQTSSQGQPQMYRACKLARRRQAHRSEKSWERLGNPEMCEDAQRAHYGSQRE